jgi:hypothetical protein
MRFRAKTNYVNAGFASLFVALMIFVLAPTEFIDSVRTLLPSCNGGVPNQVLGFLSFLLLFSLPPLLLLAYYKKHLEYYIVQEDGLLLRRGWRTDSIPYQIIEKLLPLAPAFNILPPTNRFLLMPEKGRTFVIALMEKESFLEELSKRCPHLDHQETKFGLSLQRPLNYG